MTNPLIKTTLLIAGCVFMNIAHVAAQAKMTNGPGLENDKSNKMNRMLKGDGNSFYCYRIRSKGKGTSFYVEKYNKSSLKPEFSQEVNLGEDENQTKIEDVEYASGNVFIFRRQYDKKNDKMTLFYQTVTSSGKVSDQLKEIITVSSDHYEFIDFEIYPNPSQTKFLVKACHKANKKDDYKTELILMDAVNQKKLWTKVVPQNLDSRGSINFSIFSGLSLDDDITGCIGMHLDDKDNVYYCYTNFSKSSTEKEKRYTLELYTLNAADQSPKMITLGFDDDYYVKDIEFSKTSDNEIVVGGFLKDVIERKGRDLVKCGVFSFKVNVATNTVIGKATKFFDDKMLVNLESSNRRSKYFKYKMDYIMPVGDAVYYIGEQYSEKYIRNNNNSGMGMGSVGMQSGQWHYEYMDVIVAKLNAKGDFEWIKNSPLRQAMITSYKHVFKQYIAVATNNNLYILNDDHPKNIERYQKADFEPSDLKTVSGIHGSNFVCNTMSLQNGNVTNRTVLMENEDYCFAPIQERNIQFIPPSDCEIFVKGNENDIYIYTEDRGKDRFAKIKFE